MTRSTPVKSKNTPEYAVLRMDRKAGRWESVPRDLINDCRLDLDSRSLVIWLSARPEGWEIRAAALPQLLKNRRKAVGRDRVRRMLRELEEAGYLTRSVHRTVDGRWSWQAVVSLVPHCATVDGFAVDGSAADGSAVDGKHVDIRNTVRNNRLKEVILNTTTERGVSENAVEVEPKPVFPACLRESQREAAKEFLTACPRADRQPVLDALAVMAAKGKVRNPIGLLRKLIDCVRVGTFVAPGESRPGVRAGFRSQLSREGRTEGSQRDAHPSGAHEADVAEHYLSKLKDAHR